MGFLPNHCLQGFFQQFWEKAPGQNWEKMIDSSANLGEINAQNQAILDCIMSTIPLKHKCLSIILIWVIVSHKQLWSRRELHRQVSLAAVNQILCGS